MNDVKDIKNSKGYEHSSIDELIEGLNHQDRSTRLRCLAELKKCLDKGMIKQPLSGNDVNNHIHTTYSFSPYSPSKAVWMAYNSGLKTAGIMDHDSIGGAREFIEAGRTIGMATTIGVECRVNFSSTSLAGRRLNNPDQRSIAYVALHGIPHTQIDKVKQYFKPYTEARNKRNIKMIEKINSLMSGFNISIDFEKDVVPLSMYNDGGSITERHLLYSLALKMVQRYGKGERLVNFLEYELKLPMSAKVRAYLLDGMNMHYVYDLLGALKSDLVEKFYVDADDECPDVKEIVEFSNSIGSILAYAYLGDIECSATGDKKAQKFEDEYIDELFEAIVREGFNAVTYMPSRNTLAQLLRVKDLCVKHNLLQISGEDINSSRQSFICEAQRNKEFANLYDSTWALIGHEFAATKNLEDAFFSRKTISRYPALEERIKIYKKIGLDSGNVV